MAAEGAAEFRDARYKLRVLCLYGFNNNKAQFEHHLKSFKAKYQNVIDLTVIEAPFPIDDKTCPPEKPLTQAGFKAPFYSWFRVILDMEQVNTIL